MPLPESSGRCLAGEALLRQVLLERYGLQASMLSMTIGPYGKPHLADHPGLHFNLSHSGPLVLCAVSTRPVGVDAEVPRSYESLPARAIMTKAEHRHYASLPHPEAQLFFYRAWTFKESLLKAMGTGLAMDPRVIRLDLRETSLAATMVDGSSIPFHMQELRMPRFALAALCYYNEGQGRLASSP